MQVKALFFNVFSKNAFLVAYRSMQTMFVSIYNQELANTIGGNNRAYNTPTNGPISNELPKLLLNHTSLYDQLGRLLDFLEYFGFPQSRIQRAQEVMFEDVSVMFQGSGLRSIFGILAAL